MMKTSVMRQARLARVALSAASRLHIASRPYPSAVSALSATPRTTASPCRTLWSPLVRLYSSEAAVPKSNDSSGLITRFEDLSKLGVEEEIVQAITRGMGYESMTDVQSQTINAALDGKDLIAQAKTGTGKTLAFLVPVLQRILRKQPELATRARRIRPRSDDIRAIVVSPTRELAEQIAVEASKIVRGTGIVVQCAVGGTQKGSMLRKTQREGCHILVATPGRLYDLLSDPSARIAAPNLEALVLDEADRMMETGFSEELANITQLLPNRAQVPRQTLLFSATIPKNVIGLARSYIDPNNFEFVQTIKADEVQTHDRVPQHIVPCKSLANVYPTLMELLERENKEAQTAEAPPFKAIIFLPTTSSVQLIEGLFRRMRYQDRSLPMSWEIHSKLTQNNRTRSAEEFRKARSGVLISSDVTARGMDFPNITHVIQVHLPKDRETYIHRLGRTARAGKNGEGWLLVADVEVPLARDRLPGLPIQRNTSLECASVDSRSGDVPEQFERIKEAASRLPEHMLPDAYRSLLGGLGDVPKRHLVRELNQLMIDGFGVDDIPTVSRKTAQQLGNVEGLNVGSAHPRDHALGHGRTPSGSRFGGRSDDPFESRLGDALQSDNGFSRGRSSGGFGGRGRGNGGGFSRGRGYGGDRRGGRGGDRSWGGRSESSF
ncbi:hypothetical protein OQA88_12763 [Cercophora sp. LCS_1]